MFGHISHTTITAEHAETLLNEMEVSVSRTSASSLHFKMHGNPLLRGKWTDALVEITSTFRDGRTHAKGFYRAGGTAAEGMVLSWVAGPFEETYNPGTNRVEYIDNLHFTHIERAWPFHDAPRGGK